MRTMSRVRERGGGDGCCVEIGRLDRIDTPV
jgi:hypothetical protein